MDGRKGTSSPDAQKGGWRIGLFVKRLMYVCVALFTLYLCRFIVHHGLVLLMCVILLIVGSLLYVHCEGAYSREALWSMSKVERQRFHAHNLPLFSIIPNRNPKDGQFHEWHEGDWRRLADKNSSLTDQTLLPVDENYSVHGGWPSREEVERCGNTIVLSVRHSWAGLASRINPVLNTVLNKFVKCWNRNLLFCGIRVSSYGLPFPTVVLDFPTADVATLNFGQKDDCLTMSYTYQTARQKYPTAKIIFLSVCLGGLRVLNWLSRNPNPENVIGVVLESPLPTVRHLLKGFLGRFFHEDLYRTFCMIVPNFRPELDDQYSFCRPIKHADDPRSICKIPIFVGMLETDPFSKREHLPLFIQRFANVAAFISDERHHEKHEISHGKLYRLPTYRAAAQTFLTALFQKK